MIIVTMINISYFCLFVVCDQWGETALYKAAARGYTDIVKLLLEAPGVNVNVQDKVSFTL